MRIFPVNVNIYLKYVNFVSEYRYTARRRFGSHQRIFVCVEIDQGNQGGDLLPLF